MSEVADMETRLGPDVRHVDPVFQYSRRHCVGFIRDLVKAGSVGFVETAVEHVGLFFVAKKAGARDSTSVLGRLHVDRCSQGRSCAMA